MDEIEKICNGAVSECEQKIWQNLIDAGCDDLEIKKFFESSEKCEKLKFLRQHRAKILEDLHSDQKKLNCLDYLICKMNGFCC